MPKQSPVPEGLDQPYFAALNEDRFVLQNCSACNRLQHPPQEACTKCGSGDNLDWRQLSGKGKIYSFGVVYDSPITTLQADQPYNVAVIEIDEDPEIHLLSALPGTPVDEVPIGSNVQIVFEATPETGQKVPEWEVVS